MILVSCLRDSSRKRLASIDKRLQMALLAPCGRPSAGSTQQKKKVIGKNLISGLLTVLKHQVYASEHYKCP